ncbi:integrase catalytic domain-containing protein [Trichonephila clavipes]|nr:integrase catalytic domain-containing protein [Trichonephila clavipes]
MGKNLRTPQTLVYEKWMEEGDTSQSVVEYILKLNTKLKRCQDIAITRMKKCQLKRKTWYNHDAVERKFVEGDLVMVLATFKQNKLEVNWIGPRKRFNILKDNEGRRKQHSRSFMARREPRVLTMGQSLLSDSAHAESSEIRSFRYSFWNVYPQENDVRVRGVEQFALLYIDDIAISPQGRNDHVKHIEVVLGRSRKAGLKMKPSKCKFAQEEVLFLSHRIGSGSRSPSDLKIKAIADFPRPTAKTQDKTRMNYGALAAGVRYLYLESGLWCQ